jgi:hypothetical protein
MSEIEFNNKCKEYGFEKTEIHTGFCFLHKTSIENICISLYITNDEDLLVLLYKYKGYVNHRIITKIVFDSNEVFKSVLNNFNEECKSHNK